MGEVSTIGLDIAKSVFQVHGVDATGAVLIRKRITVCLQPIIRNGECATFHVFCAHYK